MNRKKRKIRYAGLVFLIVPVLIYFCYKPLLTSIGRFIVINEIPVKSDAVIVLNSGVEIYPRLIQAADLYRQGFAALVVINGNRKSDVLRSLEKKGFQACCRWYEDSIRILGLLGVPRDRAVAIGVEDAYDTISEAKAVGAKVLAAGFQRVIIATSKFHTRRAGYIWKTLYRGRLEIRTVAADSDPYAPNAWWKSGRQIRWVLAEYGAWLYDFYKGL